MDLLARVNVFATLHQEIQISTHDNLHVFHFRYSRLNVFILTNFGSIDIVVVGGRTQMA
jgi:hypothetical protein